MKTIKVVWASGFKLNGEYLEFVGKRTSDYNSPTYKFQVHLEDWNTSIIAKAINEFHENKIGDAKLELERQQSLFERFKSKATTQEGSG